MKKLALLLLLLSLCTNTQAQYNINLVKDIYPGKSGSNPDIITAMNDSTILFIGDDYSHGKELWRSDGTESGTYMVRDICPGGCEGLYSSFSNYSFLHNGKVYFNAWDGTDRGLWVTNGTSTGTQLVKGNMAFPSQPYFTKYNGKIYFASSLPGSIELSLWVTDGTTSGTYKLEDSIPKVKGIKPKAIGAAFGKLFFTAYTYASGTELWVSDGKNAGTYMIKDLFPGQNDGIEGDFVPYNGRIYFWGKETATNDSYLYSSDGNNITLVRAFSSKHGVPNDGLINRLTNSLVYNNKLYFVANDESYNVELWVTDGTTSGTYMLKDISTGFGSSFPQLITVLNNKILFSADNTIASGKNEELWVSDGTTSGTHMLKDIYPGNSGYNSNNVYNVTDLGQGSKMRGAIFNNKLFFSGTDSMHGTELWQTDGTDTGTKMSVDYLPGKDSIYFSGIFSTGKYVWIEMNDHIHGYELFLWGGKTVVSIDDIKEQDIITSVFPNPTTGNVIVELSDRYFTTGNLYVTNVMGQIVYRRGLTNNERKVALDLRGQPKGIYNITLQLDDVIETKRISLE